MAQNSKEKSSLIDMAIQIVGSAPAFEALDALAIRRIRDGHTMIDMVGAGIKRWHQIDQANQLRNNQMMADIDAIVKPTGIQRSVLEINQDYPKGNALKTPEQIAAFREEKKRAGVHGKIRW